MHVCIVSMCMRMFVFMCIYVCIYAGIDSMCSHILYAFSWSRIQQRGVQPTQHSVRTRNNRALAPPPPTGQSCLRPARRRHLWTEGELPHLLCSPSTTSSSLFYSEISTGLVYRYVWQKLILQPFKFSLKCRPSLAFSPSSPAATKTL